MKGILEAAEEKVHLCTFHTKYVHTHASPSFLCLDVYTWFSILFTSTDLWKLSFRITDLVLMLKSEIPSEKSCRMYFQLIKFDLFCEF